MAFAYSVTCDACGVEAEPTVEPLEGVETDAEGPYLPERWVEIRAQWVEKDPEHAAQVKALDREVKNARKQAKALAAAQTPPADPAMIEPQLVATAEMQYAVEVAPYAMQEHARHFCPNCSIERLRLVGVTVA